MTTSPGLTWYELRVAGHLDDHWSGMLGDLTLTHCPDGTTTVTGPVVDQAQLHGLLSRVRDLGTPLLTLRTLETQVLAAGAHAAVPALAHPLRTGRLTLRPATTADADVAWACRRLETVGEWLTEMPTDLQAYRATFADPTRRAATVIVEHDGAVIGDFMLRLDAPWAQAEVHDQDRGRHAELGWVLDPAHAGHGCATEAVRALLGYCFDELGVHRVIATCFLADDTSRRLMEHLGMRREGHAVADSLHQSGQRLDTLTYALLATEWPS